ncbi:hypothetical protein Poli38472_011240 [Pythium oligandrum]|uniref:Uncharacterized protein n=1 Tax=Pythium oligandrum TaxID=41045 RepID=A0A8K1FKY0_PYTOL|nr:hypothetical protein Poli38472_011240 [Pythium oligandrum]|eukprot:TMW67620.1 hypothetical protein Poli38472_011240 [Pythium oligandrum]
MKLAAVLIAPTVAIASAADVGGLDPNVTLPACDTQTLLKIVRSGNSTACTAETGFTIAILKPVTSEDAPKVCGQKSCQAVFADVKDTFKSDCMALGLPFYKYVIEPTEEACAKYSANPLPPCDTAALLKIMHGENSKTCTAETGFSFGILKPVTSEDAPKVCSQKSCQAVLAEIKDTIKTECIALGVAPFFGDVIKRTVDACAKYSAGETPSSRN